MHIVQSNLKSYNVYYNLNVFLASARQNLDFVHKKKFCTNVALVSVSGVPPVYQTQKGGHFVL